MRSFFAPSMFMFSIATLLILRQPKNHRVEGFSRSSFPPKIFRSISSRSTSGLFQFYTDSDPSDYDAGDVSDSSEKTLQVDTNADDVIIRDDLKRELVLLSSVTNRGEYASVDEQNLIVDLVAQLEALNPTENAAGECAGEWDLALSSTQFFRTSPFFQTLRVSMDKNMAENAFDLHDRATTVGRVGRVRQKITSDELISEVELEVGILPGIPFKVKGTVVTTASLQVVSSTAWEIRVVETHVCGSNLPFLNELLDSSDSRLEIPVASVFQAMNQGSVPVIPLKTFYLDESMRITRDIDDNLFVFTRS